jgi:WD40 repeat protein
VWGWGKTVQSVTNVLAVAAVGFLAAVAVGQGLGRASLWAPVMAALTGIVSAGAVIWKLGQWGGPPPPLPPKTPVPEWVVDRPTEVSAVLEALLGRRPGIWAFPRRSPQMVEITTGVLGAGGFGKTTLALMVCADQRVRQRFRGYVYVMTMGQDANGAPAVAAKVNEVIKLVTGEDATFTDPELAGKRLGALMANCRRYLLVIDDVWKPEQLEPFTYGTGRCSLLVTTRDPNLLAKPDVTVQVDQMSPAQSRELLTSGLPSLDSALVSRLVDVTGRWPLLLRLANKILATAEQAGADVPAMSARLLEKLKEDGPEVVDGLSQEPTGPLDVGQPQQRARAVRATIEASRNLLQLPDAERFAELSVFARDETIPFSLAARLWEKTGGLDELQATRLLGQLTQLALVSAPADRGHGIVLHDVVRDFLRGELKRQQRLASLDEALVDAVAGALPAPAPGPGPATGLARVAWWELDRTDRYMWDHLIQHLREAGRFGEAEDVACDLRWAGARVEGCGPAALAADLSAVSTPRAGRLGAVLARVAHLLAPADPARAVVDILHSRVADDPDWGPQASALRDLCPVPRLANRWHLPDLPNAALRRVLTGHAGWVNSAAVGVAGDRVVTGGADGTARIWDPLAGQERAVLAGDAGPVTAVAAGPDGSWAVTGSSDRTARVWDPATWTEHAVLAVLAGHDRAITAVAVCPDGSWAVTGSEDKTARIWDLGTGQMHAVLAGHDGAVIAAAVCPGGGWLITGSEDGTARIWDAGQAASGRAAGIVRPAPTAVGVASAPVGLTSGDRHRTERPVVAGAITAAATAQDGSWLASGGADGTVRIRDAASAAQRAVCTGHGEAITAIAAATDYGWLVTGSRDRTARIWDAATGEQQQVLGVHHHRSSHGAGRQLARLRRRRRDRARLGCAHWAGAARAGRP